VAGSPYVAHGRRTEEGTGKLVSSQQQMVERVKLLHQLNLFTWGKKEDEGQEVFPQEVDYSEEGRGRGASHCFSILNIVVKRGIARKESKLNRSNGGRSEGGKQG